MLLWVAAAAHLVSGNIDLGLAGTLLLGSVPGVWLGSGLATRLPERGLRPALGIVMFTSGLALLDEAGAHVPAGVLIAVPLVLGAGSSRRCAGAATGATRSPQRGLAPGQHPALAQRLEAPERAPSSALSAVMSSRTSGFSGGS